jgi:hypothetical protein
MAATGHNKGFHVLDEFVCEAIHDPSVLPASPANQGRNEGMSVIEELLFDAGTTTSEDVADPDGKCAPGPLVLDDAIKTEAERLAVIIAASADPIATATLFQKHLLAELSGIRKTATTPDKLRDGGQRSGSGGGEPAAPDAAADRPRE